MKPVQAAPGIELRYDCERARLPEELAQSFEPLDYDADAQRFGERALTHRHGRMKTFAYHALRRALSDYDAYGLLGMYAMHLLSAAQLEALLQPSRTPRPRTLLDVGAGNGGITALVAVHFDRVLVTEASAVMRRRLRARGFEVLDLDLARQQPPPSLRAQAVLCLNVLDRCSHPRSLLRHLRATLADDARLVLSVPLPLTPHVQQGARTVDPDEPLPAPDDDFEAGLATIARELLQPAELRIARVARAPYLCRGDARVPLYALDAGIFVCEAQPRRV